MQTNLTDLVRNTSEGREAEGILRACVHCGFCIATCPTYQLLGDELDGPRGRIYQIKQVLEGHRATTRIQRHLDRCLTCRACETTCPSGVRYGRLLDIGRVEVERQVRRSWRERAARKLLLATIPHPNRFASLLRAGQQIRPLLPKKLRARIPQRQRPGHRPRQRHSRCMLILDGCVQPGIAPAINSAAARVLDRLGISLIETPQAGCCGALEHHLFATEKARYAARRNIDAWWPHIESGAEAIVVTASGCGVMLKEYGHLLGDDLAYHKKAARISELSLDIAEIINREDPPQMIRSERAKPKIALHVPCTLQHGLKLTGVVDDILRCAGFELTPVAESHLCCGSAGTYSILQPRLSQRLKSNKLKALNAGKPDIIATANIGCMTHLQTEGGPPVVHWIELLDKYS